MNRTIYSAAVDTSFDTRFKFNKFYEDQMEVVVRTSISHK